jgi:ankyrin repeat protein
LPETLDETYERTLLGIEKEKRKYAHRLFQCLSVAIRPLHVDELAEVLAIRFKSGHLPRYSADWQLEDAQDLVLSACSSMIALVSVDGSPVVQFSHFSVKEFLTSDRLANSTKDLSRYHVHPHSAHSILAQASLSTLLYLRDNVNKNNIKRFPFAQYAARYWVDHARFEDVSSRIQDVMERLFDMNEPSFATWIWIFDIDYPFRQPMFEDRPPRPKAVPLYYATVCGLHNLVEHLISNHPEDVNATGGNHGSAVNAALVKRNMEIALLLVQHGADGNIMDERNQTPLCIASRHGRRDNVEFLLKHRADVNLAQAFRGETPLIVSADYEELEIARILLRHGATVDTRDECGSTPLVFASRTGHLEIARLLIQSGAAVDSRDEVDTTPLMFSSDEGHLDIAQLLIQSGAAIDSQDRDGRTPLMFTSKTGHIDIAQLLIQNGAAVDHKSKNGQTPLTFASFDGRLEIVRLLIQNGAAVDTCDEEGWTPLMVASHKGHLEIARLLIQNGAAVDSRDIRGQTPLMHSSERGHLDIILLLLQSGAAVNTCGQEGWTALMLASHYGYIHVVQELIDHGAATNVQNTYLSTPLHLASANGHLSIVELLIERHLDVDKRNKDQKPALHRRTALGRLRTQRFRLKSRSTLNPQDCYGWTPLHTAAHHGHIDIVILLLEFGADVKVRNSSDQTALDVAFASRNHEVTQCLADRMGAMNPLDGMDRTPSDKNANYLVPDAPLTSVGIAGYTNFPDGLRKTLHDACGEGSVEVVQSLLDEGADVNQRDGDHATALDVASANGELEVAKLLIKYGADVNCRDKIGWTPLHHVSRGEHHDIAELLLDNGADINAKQQDLWTPLHFVSCNGNLGIVRLLLERGADIHARDIDGRTPYALASKWRYRDMVRLLSVYGGIKELN